MVKYNKCKECEHSEFEEEVYEVTGCSLKKNIEKQECQYFEERHKI